MCEFLGQHDSKQNYEQTHVSNESNFYPKIFNHVFNILLITPNIIRVVTCEGWDN